MDSETLTNHKTVPNAYYSYYEVERALKFISSLTHTKGRWKGKPFNLRPWQIMLVDAVFGTVKADGFRLYRDLYLEIPRKNGKTELGAALALKGLCADSEQGAEIYSVAGEIDQAALCFNAAVAMVKDNVVLTRECAIKESRRTIYYPKTSSFYKVLSSKDDTKHGLNAHMVIFDELHVQRSRNLWDVMRTSMSAREQPLMCALTTAGDSRTGICWERHQLARKVLQWIESDYTDGIGAAIRTLYPIIFAAYDDDSEQVRNPEYWKNPESWYKANPALGDFRSKEELESFYAECKELPAQVPTMKRLYLNMWVGSYTSAVDMAKWNLCKTEIADLRGRECYAGLDLSDTMDLSALVLAFPEERVIETDNSDHKIETFITYIPFLFCPEEKIKQKTKLENVPYQFWVDQGHVIATSGDVIDYSEIVEVIELVKERYELKSIAFDRWGSSHIVQELQKRKIDVVEFGQGYASMSAPTKDFLRSINRGTMRHNDNPCFNWQAENLVTKADEANNIKPSKDKSVDKIDGIVAAIMACGIAITEPEPEEPSIYETRGIVTLDLDGDDSKNSITENLILP